MAVTLPTLGDPADMIGSISSGMDPNELIKIQLEVGQMMMMITAVSAIVKDHNDVMKDIAGRL
jgi:hypothetical protein